MNERLDYVEVVQVIRASLVKGEGTSAVPAHRVERYYKMDGTQICDTDSTYNSARMMADINIIRHVADCLRKGLKEKEHCDSAAVLQQAAEYAEKLFKV